MQKLKLTVNIIDKHKIFKAKGSYDPEHRLLEVKKRALSREIMRFIVDPDHIYEQIGSKPRYVVFVDNAHRTSVPIERKKTIIEDGKKREEILTETVQAGESIKVHSEDDIDLKTGNVLDYHTERGFWKALIQAHKIALSTLLITMFAGYGIIRFVEWLLTAAFGGAR